MKWGIVMSNVLDEHIRKNNMEIDHFNYKEVGKFELTKEVAMNMIVLLVISLFAFGFFFTILFAIGTGKTEISGNFSFEGLLIFTFLFISTVILHELIHGAFISLYGGKPRYGKGISHRILPYFYATTDTRFRRNRFIIITLAPLVVISLVSIILMIAFPEIAQWMLIPLIINSSGAVGDLWVAIISLRHPKYVFVEDNIINFTFYEKQSDNSIDISTNIGGSQSSD